MDRPTPPAPPLFARMVVRIALAAALLIALAAAAWLLRPDGDDGSGGPTLEGAPTRGATAADDPSLGALDDNPPIVGQFAPDFVLRRDDGTTVRLSDLRGKVVWLNFWATWCVPCRKELPDIQRLYDEKRAAGLEVLAINWREDPDDAVAFMRERDLSLPVLFDTSGEVYDQYRLRGLPDSFFIDAEGRIAAVYFGFLSEERMRDRLERAGLP